MVAGTPDYRTPQHDLDVPAGRRAEALPRAALAAGSAERGAWDEAVELFCMHHLAWPRPFAGSETVRVIDALIGARQIDGEARGRRGACTPPIALLRRLARLTCSDDFVPGRDVARPFSPVGAAPAASHAEHRATIDAVRLMGTQLGAGPAVRLQS